MENAVNDDSSSCLAGLYYKRYLLNTSNIHPDTTEDSENIKFLLLIIIIDIFAIIIIIIIIIINILFIFLLLLLLSLLLLIYRNSSNRHLFNFKAKWFLELFFI